MARIDLVTTETAQLDPVFQKIIGRYDYFHLKIVTQPYLRVKLTLKHKMFTDKEAMYLLHRGESGKERKMALWVVAL